jgi:hypothetical protein
MTHDVKLALLLAFHRQQGEASPFHTYIKSLPDEHDLVTPLTYKPSELEELQDPELVECVHGKRGNRKGENEKGGNENEEGGNEAAQEMEFVDVGAVMYESQRNSFEVWMRRLQEVWLHAIFVHTYIHTYVHTGCTAGGGCMQFLYIHTYTHTYIQAALQEVVECNFYTYIHTHIRTYRLQEVVACNFCTYIHTHIRTYRLQEVVACISF